ncbi:MAG: response regulator [Proteobacteria bacterium]|nr:response regulator [Pseudomonadota bacterium]
MEEEKTILIVDDSNAMRAFIISGLEELGIFNFTEAKTGFEALKELPRKKYDLIISDINMPDINGLELLNFIKTSENYKNIPVLMISTETKEEDLNRALTMGANDYLTKPFDLKNLQRKVKKLLGLK